IKDGAEVIGNRTRVKVVKNKVSPPFKQAEFDIMYGKGISREGSLIDVAVDLGIVKKSGAWYTYEGEQLGQGRENAKGFLSENLELMIEISERVRQQVGIGDTPDIDIPLGQGIGDDDPITLSDRASSQGASESGLRRTDVMRGARPPTGRRRALPSRLRAPP